MIESARLSTVDLAQRHVVDLDQIVAGLPVEDRDRFERLYHVTGTTGHLVPPEHMTRWIDKYFGSVEAVSAQKVVKVTNRWTLDGALFNELRSRRPLEARIPADLADEIARSAPDPFCEPELNTPEDSFGRIKGKYTITASNIAKYDGFHGVVIFDQHDPLAFSRASVHDAIDVSKQWFQQCHEIDSDSIYPLVMWNCLWKSGASIPHGHMQVSLTRGMHYGMVERQRRSAAEYEEQFGMNYFDDVFRAHEALGLGFEYNDTRVFASITPRKEKECIVVGKRMDETLVSSLYDVLNTLTDRLNVVSFNVVIWHPPLVDADDHWSDFPVIVRMVDRGDPLNRTADFGAMELYAASVVSSDPFRVAEALRNSLGVD